MSTCPIDGLLTAGRRNFSLKSVRIPAKKLLASGPKFLVAEHIANFQTSPRGYRTGFDKLAVWIPILIAQEFAQGNLDADIQSNPNDKTGDQVFSGAQRWFGERPNRPVLWKSSNRAPMKLRTLSGRLIILHSKPIFVY